MSMKRPRSKPARSLATPTELEAANEEVRLSTDERGRLDRRDRKGGESVDTAMIGREGMTGLAVFLGTDQSPVRTIVQVPLTGVRMGADVLREEIVRGGTLVRLLQRHTQVVMITMAELILCNRTHRLDQRAARWLLQVDDRVDERPFGVTQEFLAQMIGVQRPALSVAMRQFKETGLIHYSRGQVSTCDREDSWRGRAAASRSSPPRPDGSRSSRTPQQTRRNSRSGVRSGLNPSGQALRIARRRISQASPV